MRKLTILLSTLLLIMSFQLKAQTQNPVWCMPPYYYNGLIHPLPIDPNPYDGGYNGKAAEYAANAIADAQGNLLFFVTDDGYGDGDLIIYNGSNGEYMQELGIPSAAISEIPVVPKSCDEYYIFHPGDDPVPYAGIFNYAKNTLATVPVSNPDSLPPNTICTGCPYPPKEPPHNKDFNADGAFCPVIAVTKPFNNGERFVFTTSIQEIKNYNGGYPYYTGANFFINIFKLNDSELTYLNSYGIGGVSHIGPNYLSYPIRSELEAIQLPNGNFRVAVDSGDAVNRGVEIMNFDQNGALVSSQTIPTAANLNYSIDSIIYPGVHGLEFTQDGNLLYMTHSFGQGSLLPNSSCISYHNFTTNATSALNVTAEPGLQYSQIELGQDGDLYFADSDGLSRLSSPSSPDPMNWTSNVVTFSDSSNVGGVTFNPHHQYTGNEGLPKLFTLPDQNDGQDYQAPYNTLACCIEHGTFDKDSFTAQAASQIWTPNNNPINGGTGDTVYIKNRLEIPAGAHITIEDMTFKFAPGAKVVVERGGGSAPQLGGRLTLDGTTFTADTDCNAQNMWLGVRVQGYQNNTTQTQQGGIILKNNSVIENAYKGAVAAKVSPVGNPYTPSGFTYDYSYAGGRIQATNSSFIDNVNDVEILNFDAANDPGNFTNCRFITNRALNNPTLYPVYHAKLVNVKNVSFSGCDFENTTTTVWNSGTYFQTGTGIYSVDAQYTVSARCLSGTPPCSNYDSCYFSGLEWGVSASNNLSSRTVTVDRSIFANNLTGIYLSTVDEATITRNNFHIPAVQFGETIGTILVNCTGYTVQENKLSGLGHSLNPGTYGIVVDNSGAAENLVYKNSFTRLSVGGQSQGQNAQTNGTHEKNDEGLHWYCNTFTTNTIHKADLAVTSGEISYHQGDQQGAADNSFSHTASPAYDIWTNPGVMIFDYYYNSSNAVYAPLRINDTLTAWAYPTSIDTNTCPSLLYNGGIVTGPPVGIGGFFMQQLSARSDSLKGAIAQKRSKIDSGNSVNMLNSIWMLGRGDILRTDLLNASPYLSDKVLLKYIETPLVPNDYKLQVLLANSPLSDTVMQVLSNFNLPSRMMQQINAAQTGISARTRLYDVISSLKRKLAYNRNTRLRIYLNDTTNSPASMDSVIAVLQRENSEAAKKQLCDVYIGMGNAAAATALRNEIAAEYGRDDYTDLLGISLQLSQSPKGLFALKDSAGLLAQVEQIAYSSVGKAASAKAKAMLSAALDTTFLPVVEPLIGTNNQRRAGGGSNQQPKYADAGTLLIYPNPTDRNNGVVIALQSKNNAKMTAPTVKIYDVTGRLAGVYRMGGKQTRITVPTNELESGIYFVKLYFDGNYIETQKLVVK